MFSFYFSFYFLGFLKHSVNGVEKLKLDFCSLFGIYFKLPCG